MGGVAVGGGLGNRGQDDGKLLAFELGWFQRGGGPSEKIREEFGIGDAEFFHRLNEYLDESVAHRDEALPPHVVEKMKAVCRKRLWLARAG
ncbi:DUF3263 domain-containing protein [Williamsia serinedens]|uniref:DUF3263 domain-containing protein n=1 Tax=Williamsia serinedens TaxID=391736 RepID=A0ABT1H1R3_9NOCA|nr:DUF3263 domain-containing protein [Williamsia serinedens]MCP2160600.1 Protein of unknown function (DUF3263) [Williamsia serinedens]